MKKLIIYIIFLLAYIQGFSQEEFIDQKPSDFEDQSVSDVPSEREDRKQGRNETDR